MFLFLLFFIVISMALPTLAALAATSTPKKILGPAMKEKMLPLCGGQPGTVKAIIARLVA